MKPNYHQERRWSALFDVIDGRLVYRSWREGVVVGSIVGHPHRVSGRRVLIDNIWYRTYIIAYVMFYGYVENPFPKPIDGNPNNAAKSNMPLPKFPPPPLQAAPCVTLARDGTWTAKYMRYGAWQHEHGYTTAYAAYRAWCSADLRQYGTHFWNGFDTSCYPIAADVFNLLLDGRDTIYLF